MTRAVSYGWYPIRAIDFTTRARHLKPFLDASVPGYRELMLERMNKARLIVDWPLAGRRVHEAPRDFEFTVREVGHGSLNFFFRCERCESQPVPSSGRDRIRCSSTAFVHPTEIRLWCPNCLFAGGGKARNRPQGKALEALSRQIVEIAAYRFQGDPLTSLVEGTAVREQRPLIPGFL